MKVKLIAWAQGDITIGDGTLFATFDSDMHEDNIRWAKLELKKMLIELWDNKNVHVMTQAEFEKYTSEN